MPSHTDESQTTLTETSDPSTNTTNTTSSSASTSQSRSTASDSQLTEHTAESDIQSWKDNLDTTQNGFAYYHVVLEEYRDLTGTDRRLRRDAVVHPSEDADSSRMPRSYGGGGLSLDSLLADIVTWYVGKLSMPYHPSVRPIPATNIRVFIPDRVQSLLQEQTDQDVDDILERLQSLPEHTPPEGYTQVLQYREQLAARTDREDGIGVRESRIDDTIRSKLGYTTQYGIQEPDSDEHYEQFSLEQLKQARDTLRDVLEFAENEQSAARDVLRDYEQNWKSVVLEETFPQL